MAPGARSLPLPLPLPLPRTRGKRVEDGCVRGGELSGGRGQARAGGDLYSGKGTWKSLVDETELWPGSSYEGEWVAGKRDGWGEFRSEIGYRYLGQWRAGKRQGEGTEWTVAAPPRSGPPHASEMR
eukprot:516897-Rhodomonas_salina.1